MKRTSFIKIVRTILVSFAAVTALWSGVAAWGGFSAGLLPSPWAVATAMSELFRSGVMLENIASSLLRFAIGYLLAISLGVLLGLVLGWYRRGYDYVAPVVHVLRPIAPVAWMPFIVLFLGIGDIPAIVIIFLAAFFPVFLSTAGAVQHLDPVYRKVAANYGITEPAVLWKVVLPGIFPAIANSLHIALGSAWVFLVSGEMVGSQSGLGFMIIDARNNLRTDHLLAAVVMIGVIGFILDTAIAGVEKMVLQLWGH